MSRCELTQELSKLGLAHLQILNEEALPPGADPLVTRFSKSANPKAMLDLVEGDYNQELLSSRLQGNAVKEGLAITLLLLQCLFIKTITLHLQNKYKKI